MKCSFCGTENVQGRTHCIACGTPLDAAVTNQSELINPAPAPLNFNEPDVQVNHVAIPEPEVVEPMVDTTITYPTTVAEPVTYDPIPSVVVEPVAGEAMTGTVSSPESNFLDNEVSPIVPSVPEPTFEPMSPTATPSEQPASAPVEPMQSSAQAAVPSYLDTSNDLPTVVNNGEPSNRVNVQFNDNDVAEMPMPVHHESQQSTVLNSSSEGEGAGELAEGSTRTGPWLALTVLFVIGILILGVIYFVYRLIFGAPQQGTVITQPLPTPTAIVTTATVVIPTTPAAVTVSANDRQRELDVADLRTAMASYYSDNGKYPNAASYNSLLNTLISTRYLTRRVQDPLFPTQQYQYSVSGDQSTYTITIQFEGLGSTLLNGSTTYQFGS